MNSFRFIGIELIAVLSSHRSGTKLLGTTSLERGTGRDQAEAIKHILNAWNLKVNLHSISFLSVFFTF